MKRLLLAIIILLFSAVPSFAAITLVKAVSVTQLALDETVSGFYLNMHEKIGIMVTTKNLYLLTEPTVVGNLYTLEKVPLPVFATDEKIVTVHWNTASGRALALQTNKNIYFFLYN